MLRRVLVATDGSARARRAEAVAGRVAVGQEVEVELLYVFPEWPARHVTPDPATPWHVERALLPPCIRERGESLLRAAEHQVRQAGEAVSLRIWRRCVGSYDVASMIVHEAERTGADLIVLGGRDHGAMPLLLGGGGVCTRVLRRARQPVLLVP
jgi:nucleotide-binding universal stress UspA family protein